MTLDVETDSLRTVASELGNASMTLSEIGGIDCGLADRCRGNGNAG